MKEITDEELERQYQEEEEQEELEKLEKQQRQQQEEEEKEEKQLELEYIPHIFLYGDNKVGKTSLLEVFKNKKISEDLEEKEINRYKYHYKNNGNEEDILIIDMPEKSPIKVAEQFHYSVYLLVYSVNDPKSFEVAINYYRNIKCFQKGCQFIFVGNKVDLERKVDKKFIEKAMNNPEFKNDIKKFIQTSAKKRKNVDELFQTAAEIVMKNIRLIKRQKEISEMSDDEYFKKYMTDYGTIKKKEKNEEEESEEEKEEEEVKENEEENEEIHVASGKKENENACCQNDCSIW